MTKISLAVSIFVLLIASVWMLAKLGAKLAPAAAITNLKHLGTEAMASGSAYDINAPSFPGGLIWINSRPLGESDLRGRVVLLDFWTYCCINCMHIIPDLKYLEEKYKDEPFVVIGVHSAKFDNEENADNIRQAVLRYGVRHPVVVDRGMKIWTQFGVNSWPTLVLIAPDGKIAGVLSGEGHREDLDDAVSSLLTAYGKEGKLAKGQIETAPEEEKSGTGLFFPGKVLADDAGGRLFIADSGNHRIVVADISGRVLDIVGSGEEGLKDGGFDEAEFRRPQGMALDGGDLYVADTENHVIRRLDMAGRTVETVAGTGQQMMWGGRGGDALKTDISSPWDICLVGRELYIAMAGSHQIWVYNLDTKRADPFAGTGREARIDGQRMTAAFAQPSGLAYLDGKLYVADSEISSLREIDLKTGTVKTLAGGDLFDFGDMDGVGDGARFQHPLGVAALDGAIYIADSYNHKVRRLDPKTRKVTSVAGAGKPGYIDGLLASAMFSEPGGISAAGGIIYLADTNNHRIRTVDIQTGEAGTLELEGLSANAAQSDTPSAEYWAGSPSKDDFWKDAVDVKSGRSAGGDKVIIDLALPDGWHLNNQLPLSVVVESSYATGLSLGKTRYSFPIKGIKLPLEFPYTLSGTASGKLDVWISGVYCDDAGTVCVPLEAKIRLDVSGLAGGSLSASVSFGEPE